MNAYNMASTIRIICEVKFNPQNGPMKYIIFSFFVLGNWELEGLINMPKVT